jgi:molecular chaperone HscB
MDPFATLGIARRYDVDTRALEKTHRELSRALHPDRYAAMPAGQRREALAKAIEINEAWRIVRDPLRRAEALLALSGVTPSEDQGPDLGAEFLLQMLEQRDALSCARWARDRRAVGALAEAVRKQFAEAERELSRGLAVGAREALRSVVGKLRFYRRFLEEVSAIEEELV